MLVVVATPIGNLGDLSPRAVAALGDADVLCCEDTRRTGRLLEHARVRAPRLVSLHAHNESERIASVIADLVSGMTVALVSDAGTPLVSDPGARLIAAALDAGIEVTTVPGASAALAALVVSGFDASRFRFEGFLPRSGAERKARLAEIARSSVPVVLFESPKRLFATLAEIVDSAGTDRRVVVARELTKLHEEVWRGRAKDALERAAANEPIGEHVIVVDAAQPEVLAGASEARSALAALYAAGVGRKEATRAVEILLGVPHRVAYAAGLELRGEGDDRARPKGGPPRSSSRDRPVR